MPWRVHTGNSRILESEADLGMLLQQVFPPAVAAGGVTLGPSKAMEVGAAPAQVDVEAGAGARFGYWSSWECHSAGMPGYEVPEQGPAGSDQFCLLERVSCCTGNDFSFHVANLESPNLPPERIGAEAQPQYSIAVRPSPEPYLIRDCHVHVPVAYLWGHGWEANPAHLLHDAVRPPFPSYSRALQSSGHSRVHLLRGILCDSPHDLARFARCSFSRSFR
jgi:hypothetical protein